MLVIFYLSSSLSILLMRRHWDLGSRPKEWLGPFPSSHDFFIRRRGRERAGPQLRVPLIRPVTSLYWTD